MILINVASAAVPAIIAIAVRRLLFADEEFKRRVLNAVCIILLFFNLARYAFNSIEQNRIKIPVEFSAVTYFVLPIIVLLKLDEMRPWGAYSGILAGGFYFLNGILHGNFMYADYKIQSIVISMLCHGALLFCGLLLISEKRYSQYAGWIITGGLVFSGIRTILLKEWFSGGRGIFIYELIFAYIPSKYLGKEIIPFYYLVLFFLLAVSIRIFFIFNSKTAKK
ncbi:MAG: hypothetical protein E7568_05065 [Ruminococcaceae bacterium]|nr:hypothetical protein [Oscillospiraceae bacterium]